MVDVRNRSVTVVVTFVGFVSELRVASVAFQALE
jgi:hypothetical protein